MHLGATAFDEDALRLQRGPVPAFVIVSSLGAFLRVVDLPPIGWIGVWSRSGSTHAAHAMPDCAIAFPTAQHALGLADEFLPPPTGLRIVPVMADEYHDGYYYASREACVAAGIDWWMLGDDEPLNTIPA